MSRAQTRPQRHEPVGLLPAEGTPPMSKNARFFQSSPEIRAQHKEPKLLHLAVAAFSAKRGPGAGAVGEGGSGSWPTALLGMVSLQRPNERCLSAARNSLSLEASTSLAKMKESDKVSKRVPLVSGRPPETYARHEHYDLTASSCKTLVLQEPRGNEHLEQVLHSKPRAWI